MGLVCILLLLVIGIIVPMVSFGIFEINKRTFKPDYLLALKRFKRSEQTMGAENDDSMKDRRRSVKALIKVMNHINKEIIDADRMR